MNTEPGTFFKVNNLGQLSPAPIETRIINLSRLIVMAWLNGIEPNKKIKQQLVKEITLISDNR